MKSKIKEGRQIKANRMNETKRKKKEMELAAASTSTTDPTIIQNPPIDEDFVSLPEVLADTVLEIPDPLLLSENIIASVDDHAARFEEDTEMDVSPEVQQTPDMPVPFQEPVLKVESNTSSAVDLVMLTPLKVDDKRPIRNVNYCSVISCDSTMIQKTFFKMPTAAKWRKKWLQCIGRKDLVCSNYNKIYVCSDHFNDDDFESKVPREVLKRKVVPSLNLPVLISDNEKRKYVRKEDIIEIQDEDPLPTITEFCKDLVPDDLLKTLKKLQSQMKTYDSYSNFPYYLRNQFYRLYCCNQDVYSFLQKSLNLPPITELIEKSVSVTTKLSEQLLAILKIKVESMTKAAKNCAVIVETISLKESVAYDIKEDKIIGFHEIDGIQKSQPATRALVVMVHGIYENWKQLVGFALLSEEDVEKISNFYFKLLINLFKIGLTVRSFAPPNIEFLDSIEVTADKPYFFIQDKKVYYMFDAKYLMKLTRDHLMLYDFHFQGQVAKMEHILKFFEYEKRKPYGFIPKHETQIFDPNIASLISTYIESNKISSSAKGTVKFIVNMNKLYDTLNRRIKCQFNETFHETDSKEIEISFFMDMLEFFQTLELIDPENGKKTTSDIKFIEGIQITITSILLLINDLKLECYDYLPTRRLSKDAIQYFVSLMQRKKKELDKESNIRYFYVTYTKYLFSNIIKPVKSDVNQLDNIKELVNQLVNILNNNSFQKSNDDTVSQISDLEINSSIYTNFNVSEMHSGFYIASFLLAKCIEYHKDCYVLQLFQKNENKSNTRYHRYMEYLANDNHLTDLSVVPTDDLVTFTETMENIFHEVFLRPVNIKIRETLIDKMKDLKCVTPCVCFPLEYFKILFIRMKIYQTVKLNNILLRTRRRMKFYEDLKQD